MTPRRNLILPRRFRQQQGGFLLNPYRFGASSGGPLYDAIMADSPFMYLRLGEASGTVAANAAGSTNGTYGNSYSLGNTALYTGGPTSYSATGSGGRVLFPQSAIPGTLNEFTLGVIAKIPAFTGTHQIISRDLGPSARYWQWTLTGTTMNFVKIKTSVQSGSASHGATAGTACMFHLRVDSSGNVKMYRNGVAFSSGLTVTAVNYGGGASGAISIGNRDGVNEAISGDVFSEAFACATALSDARIAAHAAAAGF